jgi:hypothetical protein
MKYIAASMTTDTGIVKNPHFTAENLFGTPAPIIAPVIFSGLW